MFIAYEPPLIHKPHRGEMLANRKLVNMSRLRRFNCRRRISSINISSLTGFIMLCHCIANQIQTRRLPQPQFEGQAGSAGVGEPPLSV